MSLDLLVSLLFLLVFIVLPLVSRAMRQGQPGDQTRPPGRAPTAGTPGAGEPETPPWLVEAQRRVREASGAPAPRGPAAEPEAPPLVPEDPFGRGALRPGDRTLVPGEPFDARPAPGGRGTLVPGERAPELAPAPRAGGLVPEDPFGRGLVEGRSAGGAHGDDTLGREGAPAASADAARGAAVPPGTPRGPRRGRVAMVEMMVEGVARGRRRGPHARARLGRVGLMRFDRGAIVNGLVWHEILDAPAWKRRRRRAPSRRR